MSTTAMMAKVNVVRSGFPEITVGEPVNVVFQADETFSRPVV